jgi:hypothetical protein
MACVCEDNDWERSERGDCTSPLKDPDSSPIRYGVAFDEVCYDKNHKICNRKQRNDAGVLQRVKTTQERQGYNDKPVYVSSRFSPLCRFNSHESSDPELTINQEINISSTWCKALHHSGHQISNDDKIADCHSKALDGNSGIKYDGEIRVGELRKGRKRHLPAINVSCASSLEV